MLLPGQIIQQQQMQQQQMQQQLMQQQQQKQQQPPHTVLLPAGAQPLPGMAALPALPPAPTGAQQPTGNLEEMVIGDTGTVIYKGGPPAPIDAHPAAAPSARGPLPNPSGVQLDSSSNEEFPPPPPVRSADVSLNDSNSTTQSNVTSECSEAECDREPLVKTTSGNQMTR